jgi:hypothetical protein
MAAPDARARLRDVLARAEGPIRGSWDGDELELSTSSLVAGRCTGRVRITPRGAGSELECTPASGLLQWLAVPAGLAVAALYLLRPRPAGGGMRAVSTGPLGPFLVGLSILVLTVLAWVAIVRRRQRARLRDFLCEVFEDVTRPEAEADDRAG